MADTLGQAGVLQVIPPAQLEQQLNQHATDRAAAEDAVSQPAPPTELAGYIRGRWEVFRNHRNTVSGWSERLLQALRTFNGQYDSTKLNEIRKFQGSEVYFRIIAQKCRAATSLLRDIYLSADRPWAVKPPKEPKIPDQIMQAIDQLLQHEDQMMASASQGGPPPDPTASQQRRQALMENATTNAKKQATEQARVSEDRIEDLLREGGFYHALAEFLVDISIFPFACLKGPTVKIVPDVVWDPAGGPPQVTEQPRMTWYRVSPFDLWWTPGVGNVANADVIERLNLTRAEINDLLDLPGYNQQAIRDVLEQYGSGGLYDFWDTTDAERAVLENREDPRWNRSYLITCMEFHGNVQGKMLAQYGIQVDDPLRDYAIEAWVIGPHVIKCQLSTSPRKRHPYFITSFEKVPGNPMGNGLTDMLLDIQEIANATARALVNNISIASGPQVVVRDDRLSPDETGEDLYPWKRWHVRSDPLSPNAGEAPIDFFMPTANAEQMLSVFDKFVSIADDISAIPKYIGGQAGSGGAGRTASGLAMLMGNASKILQTVSANIDRDVIEPLLLQLADLIMLTDDTGLLTGEEKISVQGVEVAIQRETLRQRQVEFLQATNNPVDQHIVGIKGRGVVLRSVARTIGLDGEVIVPPEQQLEQMQKQSEQQANAGPLNQLIDQAVNKGVAQGVQRITSELTAGRLAQTEGMPEGMPTHLGTLPGQPQQPAGPPASEAGPAQNMAHAAAQAQGSQPSPLTGGGLAPNTGNVVGNQPGKNAMPIGPGVG